MASGRDGKVYKDFWMISSPQTKTLRHYLCENSPNSLFFKSSSLVGEWCNDVTEWSPFNQLHDDVKMAALLEALVVEHHVGMVKLGEGQRPQVNNWWNPFNLDTNVTRRNYLEPL